MKRLFVIALVTLVGYYALQVKAAVHAATQFKSIVQMHASQFDTL